MANLRAIGCIVLILAFFSCDEIGPNIDFEPSWTVSVDSTFTVSEIPTPQERVVLIEEFSGVRCSNCPDGAAIIQDLLATNGGRIAAATLHAGNFAEMLAESTIDFKTPETASITDLFNVQIFPSAIFDRYKFEGTSHIAVKEKEQWAQRVNERLSVATSVNVDLSVEYFENDGILKARTTVVFTEDLSSDAYLAIYLTESGITNAQLMQDLSINESYIHNHAVRDMFTYWDGTLLGVENEGNVAGNGFVKEFNLEVDNDWDINEVELIAFVFEKNDESRNVLQAATAHIE